MERKTIEDVEMVEQNSNDSGDGSGNQDKARNCNKRVYLPGDPLNEGEELVCDESTYVMLHQAQTGSPCLSFDIIPTPSSGSQENDFPITVYIVTGTQAPQSHANNIIVMKLSNMHKTQKSRDSDESSDESDDDDSDDSDSETKSPKLSNVMINHSGCVNRVRSSVLGEAVVAASWSENGQVNIYDLTPQLQAVDNETLQSRYTNNNVQSSTKPLFSFKGHQTEGFGLDWNPNIAGMLASGDNKSAIHIWHPSEGGSWLVDQRPLVGHKDSVEDLQWSPVEQHVLASCSVDKSIRIWDTRSASQKACKVTVNNAHESDVNVIHWNRNEPLIVSGGDDGILHVWDLRYLKSGGPVATFKHHTQPVTTVEWHPSDGSVFASGGADNQLVLWDISVEKDTTNDEEDVKNLPDQLLFIHQGQKDIKELHWHPHLSGVVLSTALSGFNIFRTISV